MEAAQKLVRSCRLPGVGLPVSAFGFGAGCCCWMDRASCAICWVLHLNNLENLSEADADRAAGRPAPDRFLSARTVPLPMSSLIELQHKVKETHGYLPLSCRFPVHRVYTPPEGAPSRPSHAHQGAGSGELRGD
jgi:hypothetical protein